MKDIKKLDRLRQEIVKKINFDILTKIKVKTRSTLKKFKIKPEHQEITEYPRTCINIALKIAKKKSL